MQIQVHTNDTVRDHEDVARRIEADVADALERFSGQLTRVEIHLGDENAGKGGAADKRCMMEARPAGQQPVAITHKAATLEEACNGAVHKLVKLLEHKFGRLHDHKGAASIRDGEAG